MGYARALVAALIASGCYSPSAHDCSYTCNARACPSGLHCVNNFCREDPHAQDTCVLMDAGGSGDGRNAAYKQTILDAFPIAYWRLGDALGTTVVHNEIAGDMNMLTVQGYPVLGQMGALVGDSDTSARFDASGLPNCLNGPNAPNIDFGANATFTLEAWIRLKAQTGADFRYVFGKAANSPMVGYGIRILNDGTPEFHTCNGAGCSSVAAATTITPLQWTHVVASYNGPTNHHATLYINNMIANEVDVMFPPAMTTADLYVGCWQNLRQTDGWLDEVAIYNNALLRGDVALHFGVGTSGM